MYEKHRKQFMFVGNTLFIICILVILLADRFRWADTGFEHKTIWDWLQLIVVPAALAMSALLFDQFNTASAREGAERAYEQDQEIAQQRYKRNLALARDAQRARLFQHYGDLMVDLCLNRNLLSSQEGDVARLVARDQTILALMQVDGRRARYLFQMLREAQTVEAEHPVINLNDADFSAVEWHASDLSSLILKRLRFRNADMRGSLFNEIEWRDIDFRDADLRQTRFVNARITNVDFGGANLSGASLRGAVLINANWQGANLEGVDWTDTELRDADGKLLSKESIPQIGAASCQDASDGSVVDSPVRRWYLPRGKRGLQDYLHPLFRTQRDSGLSDHRQPSL